MSMLKRVLAVVAAVNGFAAPVYAQTGYPSKPLRYIVPYGPGGLVDTSARSLGQYFQDKMGQPVVIENRPGAGQAIGLELAAKAVPDGYTIVTANEAGLVFLTALRKSLPYDPLKDFAPIGTMFSSSFFLIVHPSLPVSTVQELIAYAKAHPGKLSFGSVGLGSSQHLAMELFMMKTGTEMVHVPYKAASASMADLLAGRTQVMFEGPGSLPHIRSSKLRGLATSSLKRSPSMPQLPTLAEAGVPGYEMSTWIGIATQASVPSPIIDRLNRELGEWLRLPATRDKLAAQSLDPMPGTPEDMAELIRSQIPMWAKVMRAAGIEPE